MFFGGRTPPPVKEDANEEIKQTQAAKILEEEQEKILLEIVLIKI